jgi:hypothetical protein
MDTLTKRVNALAKKWFKLARSPHCSIEKGGRYRMGLMLDACARELAKVTKLKLEKKGPYKTGDRVEHDLFGRGIVKALRRELQGDTIVIRFDGQGEKELFLPFVGTKLRRLTSKKRRAA